MYMMSGRIPEINSYLQHKHKFALKIRDVFSSESDKQYLQKSVGMNIWYAQGSKLDQVKMTEDLKDMKENFLGLYPSIGENLDYINSNNLKNIFFLYRKIDQYSWKYCTKGFFNFKNYIPKIVQEFI